jgi:hypothetical protein
MTGTLHKGDDTARRYLTMLHHLTESRNLEILKEGKAGELYDPRQEFLL